MGRGEVVEGERGAGGGKVLAFIGSKRFHNQTCQKSLSNPNKLPKTGR